MRERHTLTFEHGLYENLQNLSDATRIPISRLIDEALEDLFEKHNLEALWEEHCKKLEEKEKKKKLRKPEVK